LPPMLRIPAPVAAMRNQNSQLSAT
jgi:hypothetical protein